MQRRGFLQKYCGLAVAILRLSPQRNLHTPEPLAGLNQ